MTYRCSILKSLAASAMLFIATPTLQADGPLLTPPAPSSRLTDIHSQTESARTTLAKTARVETPRAPLDEFLTRGDAFESRNLWQQAADVYERGMRLYPGETNLRERWHKAERLYSLSRRFHDPSYQNDLLRMDTPHSLDLYREIVQKIQTHFVEDVPLDRLIRMGYRNLDIALGEKTFLQNSAPGITAEQVASLRRELGRRPPFPIESVQDAINEVHEATAIAQRHGVRQPASVIFEFLTAACEGLDSYSTHLTPNRLRDLYSMIDGNFVGLGVEVRGVKEGLKIVQVLSDSPAEQARLLDDEVIVGVDGRSIVGVAAEEAANLLQGKEGSSVNLSIQNGQGTVRSVKVTRREVIVHSVVDARLVDAKVGIGYIRLSSFQKLTVQELEAAVTKLRKEGMTGLILDLRGNPGGLLDVAVQVANHFVEDGVLVTTRGRAWGQSWSHRARPGNTWTFPLAVLVDGDSASASEIFAGAIQDHNRGLIIGTRTYGKGSVQSIFPLRGADSGLRLTTARFYSPRGNPFEGIGVNPDTIVYRKTGPLGEEEPVGRHPDAKSDIQLRTALESLQTLYVVH